MRRFFYLFVMLGAIATGVALNRSVNWLRGDGSKSFIRKVSCEIDPLTAKVDKPDSTRTYKVDYKIKETYSPSNIPLIYETKLETLETSKVYSIKKDIK